MAGLKKRKRSKSGKPKGSKTPTLASHVAARLFAAVAPGQRLAVGLSGGIDSMVLLDVLAKLVVRKRIELEAVHVHHGLSPNADSWARFCREECKRRGVRCRVVKVEVPRRNSVERAAREARYVVFSRSAADHVVLAHNRDDQAETVLLQLLRGAGVKGLAGMPVVRAPNIGRACIIRPLLEVPRSEIERYATRNRLRWIDDESNAETRYTRNWLRKDLLPRICERMPAYRETLVRVGQNAAEAAALLDELARIDAETALTDEALRIDVLRTLTLPRAKNVLRYAIDARGWRMPESARLGEALRQTLSAAPDRRVAVSLGSCELRRHGGFIHLVAPRGAPADADIVTWQGEEELALPGGVLAMDRVKGRGMSVARLGREPITIRRRRGGERLQPDARRPRRTVKNLLQESGIPPWRRERLPFIYCGDVLACVPGVGVESRFQAHAGEDAVVATWRELEAPVSRPSRKSQSRAR